MSGNVRVNFDVVVSVVRGSFTCRMDVEVSGKWKKVLVVVKEGVAVCGGTVEG